MRVRIKVRSRFRSRFRVRIRKIFCRGEKKVNDSREGI